MGRDLRRGLVDPDLVRWRRRDRTPSQEAFRVREERSVEDGGTALESLSREAVVHVVGCAEAKRAVVVLVVVPVEEGATMGAGVLDVHESLGDAGPVLERLEGRLREGV